MQPRIWNVQTNLKRGEKKSLKLNIDAVCSEFRQNFDYKKLNNFLSNHLKLWSHFAATMRVLPIVLFALLCFISLSSASPHRELDLDLRLWDITYNIYFQAAESAKKQLNKKKLVLVNVVQK